MAEEQSSLSTSNEVLKQKNLKTFAMSFGIVVVAVIIITLGVGVFRVIGQGATDGFSRAVATLLRLPAAKVNGKTILFKDYTTDLEAIKKVRDYDIKNPRPGQPSAANFSDEELSDQVLLLAAANILTEDLAKERNVTVTVDDLKGVHDGILAQLKTEEAIEKEVMDRYGWNYKQYEERVVRSALLKSKLSEVIATDIPAREAAQKKAESILEQVKKGGDFAELAKQYSEDGSAAAGGLLDEFGVDVMYPTFEEAVKKLKDGETTQNLVETQFGFHIIHLDSSRVEKTKDAKGKTVSNTLWTARHILIMYPNINKQLNDLIKQATVHLYINVHNPFRELTK